MLYEQIKTQNKLQKMLTTTLQEKMGKPLDLVVKSIEQIEGSNNRLEDSFKEQIKSTRIHAQLIIYQLKDM